MTPDGFRNLRAGDVVRNNGSGHAYVVLLAAADVDGAVIVTHTLAASDPSEWDLVGIVRRIPDANERVRT